MPISNSKRNPGARSAPPNFTPEDNSSRGRARIGIASVWKKVGPLLGATMTVGIAAMVAPLLQRLPHASLSLLFLTVVIIVAARWGLWLSIYASLLSFLVYNFFFTLPLYTLAVEAEGDVATLVFFLAMAALTGNLASRMRDAMARREAVIDRISTLYDFSRRVSAAARDQEILDALRDYLTKILRSPVAVLLPDEEGRLAARATGNGAESPESFPIEAAALAWRDERMEIPGIDWRFLPLATSNGRVGLVAIRRDVPGGEFGELVTNLCSQAAVGIERTSLSADLREARMTTETEQLRSALLSSVSHDLRTPLSSIIGSTTSLIEYGDAIDAANRRELLETILSESERLNRYIQNLLDMTRLGRGELSLRRDWVDLNDVISTAADRLHSALSGVELHVDIAPDAALLHVHAAMLEQAFVNLLDNAARFSPEGGRISVTARRQEDRIVIDVVDQGPGIPAAEQEKIFDMFYSADRADTGGKGTGLGLSICRGLLGAHGGELVALDGPGGRGTCMRISLPFTSYADIDDDED